MAVAVKLPVPLEPPEMIQMANLTQPQIQDFADIEDYFAALDEYFEVFLYGTVFSAA